MSRNAEKRAARRAEQVDDVGTKAQRQKERVERALKASSLCHVCKAREADSNEHIPPAAAGNTGAWDVHYLELRAKDAPRQLLPIQNGFWRRTLCTPCNNGVTSRYVPAYVALVDAVRASNAVGAVRMLRLHDFDGLSAAKLMVSMLLATPPYPPHKIWDGLREFVLNEAAPLRTTGPSPRLFLYANDSENGRIVPVLNMIAGLAGWSVLASEISFPPLGVVAAFDDEPTYLIRAGFAEVTSWGRLSPSTRVTSTLALPARHVASPHMLVFGDDAASAAEEQQRMMQAYVPKNAPPGGMGVLLRPRSPAAAEAAKRP